MYIQSIQSNDKSAFCSRTQIIATPKGRAKLKQVLTNSRGKYMLIDFSDRTYNPMENLISKPYNCTMTLLTGKDYFYTKYMKRYALNSIEYKTVYINERSNGEMQKLLRRTENKQDQEFIDGMLSVLKLYGRKDIE